MAGIAGIVLPNCQDIVDRMLNKIIYRGKLGKKFFFNKNSTFGIVFNRYDKVEMAKMQIDNSVKDEVSVGHLVAAYEKDGKIELIRDQLGVMPLYFGKTQEGTICFASEVKALLTLTNDVEEFLPGFKYQAGSLNQYFILEKQKYVDESPEIIANNLRALIQKSIKVGTKSKIIGSWLSGGLDSSTLAALAVPYTNKLYTFSSGIKGAPDLEYAKEVSKYIGSEHHELIVVIEDMVKVIPEVIYHLESFDALLVRSSIINYLIAKEASNYVEEVFSGEGADELFAGYQYLKQLKTDDLAEELITITNNLHNTALQRVDRCSSAHGTVAHVCFLYPELVDYALKIPLEYKIHNGIEKWILRLAVKDHLPHKIVYRTKAKFWEGAGVNELMDDYANKTISDNDFKNERKLANGWILHSKEELYYFRIFKEYFGNAKSYSWIGRTKGAPIQN